MWNAEVQLQKLNYASIFKNILGGRGKSSDSTKPSSDSPKPSSDSSINDQIINRGQNFNPHAQLTQTQRQAAITERIEKNAREAMEIRAREAQEAREAPKAQEAREQKCKGLEGEKKKECIKTP